MSKGYIIGHIAVNDADETIADVERDEHVLHELGGRFIVRSGRAQIIEGTELNRHVVIEFPTFDAALAAYNDPGDKGVADICRRSADSVIFVAEATA